MMVKTPRWLLLLEAVLLLGALIILAYKAATRVLPLPTEKVEQGRRQGRPDPQTQLLQYYFKYPDRYLRIANEHWQFNPVSRMAYHSFTIRNIATLAYTDIEVTLTYEGSDGKILLASTRKIPGVIAAFKTLEVKQIKVPGVPKAAANAVITIAKAVIVR
jgi:hypothetical protein